MALLLTGLVLLIGVHLVPSLPALRQQLVSGLGERPYRGGFALLSLAGLSLIVVGMGSVTKVVLWQPPAWGWIVPLVLMLPVCILMLAAYVPGNLKRLTPNPMLWGVILWSASHLLANGGQASVTLFAALGLYALYAIYSANSRGAQTSVVRGPVMGDLVALLGGLGLYVLIFFNHTALFGVPVTG